MHQRVQVTQGTPTDDVKRTGQHIAGSISDLEYWVAAQPAAKAATPLWLKEGVDKLSGLHVTDALGVCQEARLLIQNLDTQKWSVERGRKAEERSNQVDEARQDLAERHPCAGNGILVAFIAPRPEHGESQDLFDVTDADKNGSMYILLHAARALSCLEQVSQLHMFDHIFLACA